VLRLPLSRCHLAARPAWSVPGHSWQG
jgi:hypothetical protein